MKIFQLRENDCRDYIVELKIIHFPNIKITWEELFEEIE